MNPDPPHGGYKKLIYADIFNIRISFFVVRPSKSRRIGLLAVKWKQKNKSDVRITRKKSYT